MCIIRPAGVRTNSAMVGSTDQTGRLGRPDWSCWFDLPHFALRDHGPVLVEIVQPLASQPPAPSPESVGAAAFSSKYESTPHDTT
jgi:hypothetical protein